MTPGVRHGLLGDAEHGGGHGARHRVESPSSRTETAGPAASVSARVFSAASPGRRRELGRVAASAGRRPWRASRGGCARLRPRWSAARRPWHPDPFPATADPACAWIAMAETWWATVSCRSRASCSRSTSRAWSSSRARALLRHRSAMPSAPVATTTAMPPMMSAARGRRRQTVISIPRRDEHPGDDHRPAGAPAEHGVEEDEEAGRQVELRVAAGRETHGGPDREGRREHRKGPRPPPQDRHRKAGEHRRPGHRYGTSGRRMLRPPQAQGYRRGASSPARPAAAAPAKLPAHPRACGPGSSCPHDRWALAAADRPRTDGWR